MNGCRLGRRRRWGTGWLAIDGENCLANSGGRQTAGLKFHAEKHISIFMRTTFDLPDDLMKRAKIAAVKRGSSLRDLVAEALSRLLAEQSSPKRKRMTEAPIKLPPGHTIPIRSNSESAQLFDQEDITHLNDVYSGR